MAALRCWMAGGLVLLGARLPVQLPAQESVPLPVGPRLSEAGYGLAGGDATLTVAGAHDSSIGWYTVVTPTLSYTSAGHYAVDASLPFYPNRLVEGLNGKLAESHGEFGDTLLAAHASFAPGRLQNTTTFSFTLPTGNQVDGLGLGRATVDLSNHSERYFGRRGLLLDVGVGDSSALFNRLTIRQDSTLAPIAHFQTGVVTALPFRAYVQTTAYEQLPLGDQKLYTTYQRRGAAPVTLISGHKAIEDNGFATQFTLPVAEHVAFSSSYTRSLRLHLDTVTVGLTYSWRGFGRGRDVMMERALAEAETVR